MKKKLCCLFVGVILLVTLLAACGNQTLIDTTYTFDYAVISLPDGRTVSGQVTSWKDYENSDSIQLTIDSNTYYTHLTNVCLMTKALN